MQTLIQFSKRQQVSDRQKIGIALLLLFEVISSAYHKFNEKLGLQHYRSDRVWFYGFFSSVMLICVVYGIAWYKILQA